MTTPAMPHTSGGSRLPSHQPAEGTPVRIVDGPYLREHRVIGSVVRPHDPKYVRVSVLAPDLYGHGHVYLDLLPHEVTPITDTTWRNP